MNAFWFNREEFDKKVDELNIDTSKLFKLSLGILQEKIHTDTITEDHIQDIIEYAKMRYERWEYAKAVYYCYFALLEIMQDISKTQNKSEFISIIRDSLERLLFQWKDAYPPTYTNTVTWNYQQTTTMGNSKALIEFMQLVQMDTTTLMSFAARKMSSMERISEWQEIETLSNFHHFYDRWEYENALHEIYFSFSNFFLKKDIAYHKGVLQIFKDFCDDWLSKIENTI